MYSNSFDEVKCRSRESCSDSSRVQEFAQALSVTSPSLYVIRNKTIKNCYIGFSRPVKSVIKSI